MKSSSLTTKNQKQSRESGINALFLPFSVQNDKDYVDLEQLFIDYFDLMIVK
jgi:hypothetical protein